MQGSCLPPWPVGFWSDVTSSWKPLAPNVTQALFSAPCLSLSAPWHISLTHLPYWEFMQYEALSDSSLCPSGWLSGPHLQGDYIRGRFPLIGPNSWNS